MVSPLAVLDGMDSLSAVEVKATAEVRVVSPLAPEEETTAVVGMVSPLAA